MEVKEIYEQFLEHLENDEKEKAVAYILERVEKGDLGIIDLYAKVLTPGLNGMVCKLKDKRLCIWKEHEWSSIVRTIIECCYPYVIKEREKLGVTGNMETVVIMCPQEEYHELGARIGADYFTILGYNTIFLGSNTPLQDFVQGIDALKPKYVVISVSNYYNLIAAKRLTEAVRKEYSEVTILAAGQAFKEHKDNYKKIGAHKFIDSFEDVAALGGVD